MTSSRRSSGAMALGAVEEILAAQAELALLAAAAAHGTRLGRHARPRRRSSTRRASPTTRRARRRRWRCPRRTPRSAPDEARAALARAHRLRPLLDHGFPWLLGPRRPRGRTRAISPSDRPPPRAPCSPRPSGCSRCARDLGLLADEAQILRDRVAASGGRNVGDEPHGRGTAAAALSRHSPRRSPRSRDDCSSRATPSSPRRCPSTASSSLLAQRGGGPSRRGRLTRVQRGSAADLTRGG